jgi:hypothetical protein
LLERGDVLDAAGGTDIFQMPAGRVKITTGVDAVRCLRLSDKAKILRWYADCCRTPIANTAAGPRFPVVALIHHERDGRCRGEMLGPPLCRICEHSATGPLPANAAPLPSFGVFVCRAAKLLGGGAGSVSQIRSLTISRARRSPCRACSHRVSAPPFNGVASEKGSPTFLSARKAPTAGVLDCTDSLD